MYWLFLCRVVYHYENQLLVCFIVVLLDSLSIYNLHANYLCGITIIRSAWNSKGCMYNACCQCWLTHTISISVSTTYEGLLTQHVLHVLLAIKIFEPMDQREILNIFEGKWNGAESPKPKGPHPPKLVCMHFTSTSTCMNFLSRFYFLTPMDYSP